MPGTEKLDTYREIELAEGVRIQLRPAGVFPRLLARMIDLVVYLAIMMLVGVVVSLLSLAFGSDVGEGVYRLIFFVVWWFYDPLMEMTKWGGSLGKRLMNLRVVRMSGMPVDFGSAFLRQLLFWIDFLPFFGVTGAVTILTSRYSQRLGDLLAGTLVIYAKEVPVFDVSAVPAPLMMPGVALERAEELAFLEFAAKYDSLSGERRSEITAPLAELQAKVGAPNPTAYALGVARWIAKSEA